MSEKNIHENNDFFACPNTYFSGGYGNTDPAKSIGGAINDKERACADMRYFWPMLGDESIKIYGGRNVYGIIYIRNDHPSQAFAVGAYVKDSSSMKIGVMEPINHIAQILEDRFMDPGIDFVECDRDLPLNLGDFEPGDSRALYLRQTMPEKLSEYNGRWNLMLPYRPVILV